MFFHCINWWIRSGPPKTHCKVNNKCSFLVFGSRVVTIYDRNAFWMALGSCMRPGCFKTSAWGLVQGTYTKHIQFELDVICFLYLPYESYISLIAFILFGQWQRRFQVVCWLMCIGSSKTCLGRMFHPVVSSVTTPNQFWWTIFWISSLRGCQLRHEHQWCSRCYELCNACFVFIRILFAGVR